MPDVKVGLLLKARDEATSVINGLVTGVGSLESAVAGLFKGGGDLGVILAASVAAAGAAIAIASKISTAVEQLDRAAFTTGTTMEKLQAVQEVVLQGGGDLGSVEASMSKLNKAIGLGEPVAKKLGLTVGDTFDQYVKLATILTNMTDIQTRDAVASKLLGRSYAEVLPDMQAIVKNATAMEEKLRATGGLLSGDTAEAARKAHESFALLGETWRTLGTNLGTLIVPGVTLFLRAVGGMLGAINAWVSAIKDGTVGILGDLSKAAEDSTTYAEKIQKAQDEVRTKYHGKGNVQVGVPTIGGVEVSAERVTGLLDKDKGPSEREKRLEGIMRVLFRSREEAERYLKALEEVEHAKERATLKDKLVEANMLVRGNVVLPASPRGGDRIADRPVSREIEDGAHAGEEGVHTLLRSLFTLQDALNTIGSQWKAFGEQMVSSAGIVQMAYDGLWTALQTGMGQVFAGLISKGQTFKSAFLTVFRTLGQEVMSILAKIAAAKIFTFVIGLLAGGPVGAAGSLASETSPFGIPIGHTLPVMGPVNNFNVQINAMDKSGAAASLLNPRGELRHAMEQAALMGAQ